MAAAANVSGTININLAATQVQASGTVGVTANGGSLQLQPAISVSDQLTNGTGAAKVVDQVYAKQLYLNAAATTLHFGNGSVTDLFGNTVTMARIRLLAVQVIGTAPGDDVKVYQAASDGITWLPPSTSPLYARANFGDVIVYDPNSTGAGVGNVISGTTDGVTLDPGANAVYVNVMCIGDSVA